VEEAQRLGVEIRLDSTVVGINFERPSISLKGKPDLVVDIVIGADGLRSICRGIVLGRPDPPHLTGDLAYRIIVKVEDMEKYQELRELFDPPCINFWMGPDAHAVCYFLQSGSLCNIVLIRPDNLPDSVNIARADLQEMRDHFHDWDPRLKTILELVQETSKWKLRNSREMQTWSHPSGRLVLLGDACHATLPYL
jgi:salicylate hydroxylase